MSLQKVLFPGKLLSICSKNNSDIYVGDSYGRIYHLQPPYLGFTLAHTAAAPVSCLIFHDVLFYGDWDGNVAKMDGRTVKLGRNIIKAMFIYQGHVYISAGLYIYIMSLDLDVLQCICVEHKILAFSEYKSKLYCGTGVSFIYMIDVSTPRSTFDEVTPKNTVEDHSAFTFDSFTAKNKSLDNNFCASLTFIGKNVQNTSILSMVHNLSGSADHTLVANDFSLLNNSILLYKGSDWIRSIYNEHLFVEGNKVVCDVSALRGGHRSGYQVLYDHEDNASAVIYCNSRIISIGLDCCLKVYNFEEILYSDEEREISELNSKF